MGTLPMDEESIPDFWLFRVESQYSLSLCRFSPVLQVNLHPAKAVCTNFCQNIEYAPIDENRAAR